MEWRNMGVASRLVGNPTPFPPPPTLRGGGAMAYDEARGVCVLFGGHVRLGDSSTHHLNDTWEWDGSVWAERQVDADQAATNQPSRMQSPLMAYDGARNKTV